MTLGQEITNLKIIKRFSTIEQELQVLHPTMDFSESVFIGTSFAITYKCSTCGTYTTTRLSNLLARSGGCKKCMATRFSKIDEFVPRAVKVHGGMYDYSNAKYVHAHHKVNIKCNQCGNNFMQSPSHHINGHGCPTCNLIGVDYSDYLHKPGILYFINIVDTDVYKLGITSTTLKKRFGVDFSKIKVLWTKEYDALGNAFCVEQSLLKANVDYKYYGEPLLLNGNSELVTTFIECP